MSYHGNPPYDYNKTGITVVNPLRDLQRKLDKIKVIVNELGTDEHENAGVVSIEYIWQIADILDGEDVK
jgi:hypothetical protein